MLKMLVLAVASPRARGFTREPAESPKDALSPGQVFSPRQSELDKEAESSEIEIMKKVTGSYLNSIDSRRTDSVKHSAAQE